VITPATCSRLLGCLLASLVLIGCQGTGQTVNFDPRVMSSHPANANAIQEDALSIVVEPFKDARPQQQRLGSRTHMWGGVTNFNAWNGNVSEGMANLAVDYLQQQQWRASRGTADQANDTSAPDVNLTGTVLSLNANAKSGLGFTTIKVDMKVQFEAKNTRDGSTVRMVLGANGSDSVSVFDPKDVERLLNLVAKDLYKQLFQDLRVKDRSLHLHSKTS